MAHWKDAAVTNDGVEMLNEWMAGRFIRITSAYGGTGTVDAAFLTEQTDLVERRQQLHLLGEEDNAKGKTVQIQVSNAEVMEEYELNQVGVYAKLDPERDPDASLFQKFMAWLAKGFQDATTRGGEEATAGENPEGTVEKEAQTFSDNITREQLAVMLWRYAGSPAATNKELHFSDESEISGYAMEALRWAVENGILNGYGDGRLGPQGQATRAQVAQMLKNFIEHLEEAT